MILSSLSEILSIGVILPFLGVLTAPEQMLNNDFVQLVSRGFGLTTPDQVTLFLAAAFCVAALLAGAVRLLMLYANTRFSYALGADLSLEVYRRTLYQPYLVHSSRNSSEIINGIVIKTASIIGNVLAPILTILSSVFLTIGIVGALLAIDWIVSLSATVIICVIYGTILKATRDKMRRDSEVVAHESSNIVRSLQEGLGGIRDVLLDGTQEVHARIYQASDRPMRRAQGRIAMGVGSPRFIVESLGMILIAVLAVFISQREGGGAAAIPLLGALALGAQRLLPIAQQAYAAVATIRGTEASLADIMKLLDQPMPAPGSLTVAPMAFDRQLTLHNIGFSYPADRSKVLRGVDLVVPKGARIGFFGPTGGGKSTLLDIVMGLLPPSEGELLVDGQPLNQQNMRGWQAHIVHVPQTIFLADSSVAENIAFGVPSRDVDMDRVVAAAKRAQIHDAIVTWPYQYSTSVGERGLRLSGGQRQRIGIARALYKSADVIILDEATSALDTETETRVMEAIVGCNHDTTMFIVAHRLTTLKGCDLIAEMADGGIRQVGTFDEVIRPRLDGVAQPALPRVDEKAARTAESGN